MYSKRLQHNSWPLVLVALLTIGGTAWTSPIAREWIYTTVRVQSSQELGTGFLVFRHTSQDSGDLFLVTNKHVVAPDTGSLSHARSLLLFINAGGSDNMVTETKYPIPLVDDLGQRLWRGHPDPRVDVLAVDITALIVQHPEIHHRDVPYSFFATHDTLRAQEITQGDEVLIIGYPDGRNPHVRSSFPIVRQGTIASVIGEQIKVPTDSGVVRIPGFEVDSAIIPGSSGSPVVLKPKTETATPFLLGIISGTLRTQGLGIAYDAETIKETIELFFR